MGGEYGPYLLIGGMLFLVACSVPIAYALATMALVLAVFIAPDRMPAAILLKTSDSIDEFALLAIPFFVFAGNLMAEGGMAWRLVAFAQIFIGWMRGGLAMVNILASMFFGGISGSAVADTSSIGALLIPMMKKEGYSDAFSVNVTISSATQGIIIPPSHNAIIYAWAAGGSVSVAALFLAGAIPGILVGLSLMVTSYIISAQRNYPKGRVVSIREALKITWQALLGLVTVVIIVGGVIFGFYTPTESAAVACVWAFLVTMFIYRDLKWSQLPGLLHGTVKTVCMVMIVVGFAGAFGYLMTLMQIPHKVSTALLSASDNKYVILALINLMLLVFGTFMDMAPLILICTPILLPVIKALGMSDIQFGIVIMLNLCVGLLTPPVGTVLFVGCAIGKITIEEATRELWPFWLSMLVILLLVTYIPAISLWLPSLRFDYIKF